uniref:Uncharacterized protein n=1 Tax=Kalanchoe fedtschenkoi TaxID=63787 RepID=A0A7N0TD99_KALFE
MRWRLFLVQVLLFMQLFSVSCFAQILCAALLSAVVSTNPSESILSPEKSGVCNMPGELMSADT